MFVEKNLASVSRDTPTPMIKIEKVLVKVLIQHAKMNKPITCSKSLDLANSMIKDSNTTEVTKKIKEVYSVFDSRK